MNESNSAETNDAGAAEEIIVEESGEATLDTSEGLNASNDEDSSDKQEQSGDADEGELTFEQWEAKENQAKEVKKEETQKQADKDKEEADTKKAKEKADAYTQKDVEYTVNGQKATAKAEDIPHMLAKAAGADARFQEAANLRSEAHQFVKFFKNDPKGALERAGHDFDKLAMDYVYDKFNYDEMSPEQQKAHDNSKELEKVKAENDKYTKKDREDRERVSQQKEHEAKEQRVTQEIQTLSVEIETAVSNSSLPQNKFVTQSIVKYLQDGIKQGYNLTAADVIPYVEQDYKQMREQDRQTDVAAFKANQKESFNKKEEVQTNKKKGPKKRYSSIYEMLDDD